MRERDISSMVDAYKEERPLYEAYTKKIGELIKALLEEPTTSENIRVHSVTTRTKEVDKFSEKVRREGKEYKNFFDVTDLSGVRIICYYKDDVDKVAEIIRENFLVHLELSIDKREILDPDRFGYLSLHYVVELSQERVKLKEYERFKNLLCEVQIRTILQHSWAEIEHDLGYKSHIEVPRDIRRRFCRLAGLLELGDDEFYAIRGDIAQYTEKIGIQLSSRPADILIDKVSLDQYIKSSSIAAEIDKVIADLGYAKLHDEYEDLSRYIESLLFFDIETIANLDNALKDNKNKITDFAKKWLTEEEEEGEFIFLRGISLFYLCYILAGQTQNLDKVMQYLDIIEAGSSHEYKKEWADRIISTYKEL
jgi:putative GTP pyrophosphokinase